MKRKKPFPSVDRLLEAFKDLGNTVQWRISGKGIIKGRVVTCVDGRGYLTVTLDGHQINVHRVLWIMRNGPIPQGMYVDHIDRDKLHNFPINLRLARPCENNWNRAGNRNNTSGHKGVSYNKNTNKWQVQMLKDGQARYFGSFDNLEDAALEASRQRERLHGSFHRHA